MLGLLAVQFQGKLSPWISSSDIWDIVWLLMVDGFLRICLQSICLVENDD